MNLNDVTQGDIPADETPSTLREQLERVRDVLWGRLSTPGMRADALAPVAKAYMEACMRLDALPNDAEGSVTDGLADELAARRRRPTPADGVETVAAP